jgi:CRISPR/Cas system-associated exonuclease Cas4 (RecB family)
MSERRRRPIGLSSSGHCRMELWLSAHDFPDEEVTPSVKRKFEMGHLIEAAVFDSVTIPGGSADDGKIGPWYRSIGMVQDYQTGKSYDTTKIEIADRQDEVEIDGFLGHVDGIGGPDDFYVEDSKSMPSYSFQRNIKDNLQSNPFTREQVVQQQMYIHGERIKRPSLNIEKARLWMVNRDDLAMAVRVIGYDPALVEEGRERLTWARSKSEPKPDYAWTPGLDIPTRCGYCSFREACSEVRGQAIEKRVEKGRPFWAVKN